MSQASKLEVFHRLGQHAAVVGHLNNYLRVLEPDEERKFQALAEVALFDSEQHGAACVQYGRLQLVRELMRDLEPYIKQHDQQYTR